MKKSDIVLIVLAVIAFIGICWIEHIHDVNLEKALMDESWWVYVQ